MIPMKNTTQRSIIFMLNHPLIALKISHLKQKRSFNKPGRCEFLWRDCSQLPYMNIQTTLRTIAAPTKIIIATIFNFQNTSFSQFSPAPPFSLPDPGFLRRFPKVYLPAVVKFSGTRFQSAF